MASSAEGRQKHLYVSKTGKIFPGSRKPEKY
jgi:hypothetical protein